MPISEPTPTENSNDRTTRTTVIGGGIAGIATATLLARGGHDVTLVEAHELGGRAGRLDVDGFRFDTGPSWYLMPEAFEQYFSLLGEKIEDHLDLVMLDPGYRVFFEDGAVLDIEHGRERNIASFDALQPGAGETLTRYLDGADEAYDIALDRFLYSTFRNPLAVLNVRSTRFLPRLFTLLSRSLDSATAGFADARLRQVLGYTAVFLGSAPKRVPALYKLMSHLDLVDGVRYPQGGMYTIIEAMARLAEREGVEIRTNTAVGSIETVRDFDASANPGLRRLAGSRRASARATGVRLADGSCIEADLVVSTADLHHTETELLTDPALRTYSKWDRRGPGFSALLMMLGVEGELPDLLHHNLFFTRDWDANFEAILGKTSRSLDLAVPVPASVYVSKTSATDPGAAPDGHENLFVLVPFPADTDLGSGGQDELAALSAPYLDQIAEWANAPDLRSRIVVERYFGPSDFGDHFHAFRGTALGLEHTLRQSALFRPAGQSKRVANLMYAGANVQPGVGLPMCLISAELVAKRLLGDTSASPMPGPLAPGFLR